MTDPLPMFSAITNFRNYTPQNCRKDSFQKTKIPCKKTKISRKNPQENQEFLQGFFSPAGISSDLQGLGAIRAPNMRGLRAIPTPSWGVLGSSRLQEGESWAHFHSTLVAMGIMLGDLGQHVGLGHPHSLFSFSFSLAPTSLHSICSPFSLALSCHSHDLLTS